ncbi:MAG: hypothetical protein RL398_400 [Planctomycetota bacterium]
MKAESRPIEEIVSPEGVPLRFGAAAASERIVAFAFDFGILVVASLLLSILFALVFGPGGAMLVPFVLRQGYFVWFETRWNGTTPGKRRFDLRVVRADGGPLSTEILLARNLTREVEFFLPLTVIYTPDALFAEHEGVVRLVASLWVLGLLFFPLGNPKRLRIGDLLAGTRVVHAPRAQLLRDMADQRVAAEAAKAGVFTFREAQLTVYGEHELQVLEEVLRKARLPGGAETVAAVAAKIARRIGWEGPIPDREGLAFLRDFYAAQRRHLEHALLLGKRRERKASPAKSFRSPPPPRR